MSVRFASDRRGGRDLGGLVLHQAAEPVQEGDRASEVVSDRGEAHLQSRSGQAEPTHPTQLEGPLPGAGHRLDAAADAANGSVARQWPRERLGPALPQVPVCAVPGGCRRGQ